MHCCLNGYESEAYRKKLGMRQEWRVINIEKEVAVKQEAMISLDTQQEEEGFTSVPRRKSRNQWKMNYTEAYFSWTNKKVQSRIDRVLCNVLWFTSFDYIANKNSLNRSYMLCSSCYGMIQAMRSCNNREQSKLEWLNYGDQGSRFVLAKMKQYAKIKLLKINSYVYCINDEHGQMIYGFHAMATAALCDKTYTDKDIIKQGASLCIEQQLNLCRPFSERDIKDIIFSIASVKSLILDGFSSSFYKNYCQEIGSLICNVVM
ncbi:hypothetical protein Cgig2_010855 [Carnegiea gigantea]|uniref:Uncharacterized protein n=1 Tax=Carnegiea gigantea TaxID=171969 RepID=A0A9Q1GQU3_9CARY|nr:hypothetical protein Cgig2_010855 [Carnegiea gigantea]